MKKIYLLAFFTHLFSVSFSQKLIHGIGTGLLVEKIRGIDPELSFLFTYSPRINVSETQSMSLSLGIPLSIGIGGSFDQGYTGDYTAYTFWINTPLILNVNFGAGSTKQNKEKVGFFAGGGFAQQFGLHTSGDYTVGNSSSTTSTYGPTGNIGFRFAVGSHQKNIETKMSYMRGIGGDYEADIYSLQVLFNF